MGLRYLGSITFANDSDKGCRAENTGYECLSQSLMGLGSKRSALPLTIPGSFLRSGAWLASQYLQTTVAPFFRVPVRIRGDDPLGEPSMLIPLAEEGRHSFLLTTSRRTAQDRILYAAWAGPHLVRTHQSWKSPAPISSHQGFGGLGEHVQGNGNGGPGGRWRDCFRAAETRAQTLPLPRGPSEGFPGSRREASSRGNCSRRRHPGLPASAVRGTSSAAAKPFHDKLGLVTFLTPGKPPDRPAEASSRADLERPRQRRQGWG